MEKQEKVIDASVVVKWFSHEKDSDKAIKIKSDFLNGNTILIVQSMIFLETINALRYKKRNERQLIHANEELFKLDLKLEGINKEILSKTIENSIKYKITIYDALYVTLAQIYGTFLITADKELYKVPNVIALEKI
mgnify:CR=1 FL=1